MGNQKNVWAKIAESKSSWLERIVAVKPDCYAIYVKRAKPASALEAYHEREDEYVKQAEVDTARVGRMITISHEAVRNRADKP
jgi:hypothetical protein